MNGQRLLLYGCLLLSLLIPSFIYSETDTELEEKMNIEEAAYQEYIVYVSELQRSFAKQIKEELNLHCCGTGGMMHGKIEDLRMEFCAKRRANVEEARALMLLVMDKFVDAINANEKVQPFLETKPVTYKQVEIAIEFPGINGRQADGSVYRVSSVSDKATPLNKNHFFYCAEDPMYENGLKQILRESYEEAVSRNALSPVKNPAVHGVTEKEEEIDRLLFAFRNEMVKKHRIECSSVGGKMTGNIEEIGAKFVAVRPATQEEARAMILDLANHLLKKVNESEKIKPYLAESPYPVNRLKLRLSFTTRTYGTYTDGTMDTVIIDEGKITYYQRMLEEEMQALGYFPGPQILGTETYEEALEKNVEIKKVEKSLFSSVLSWCKRCLGWNE